MVAFVVFRSTPNMYRLSKALLLLTTVCSYTADGANILAIFIFPSYSHQMPLLAVSKALAARGHNLTVITPNPSKVLITNHTEIDISFGYELLRKGKLQVNFQAKVNPFRMMVNILKTSTQLVEAQIKSPPVQNFLRWAKDVKFDLVLFENVWAPTYLAMVYTLGSPPVVSLSSLESNPMVDYFMGTPANLAYVPSMLSVSDHMTFSERLHNAALYTYFVYCLHRYHFPDNDRVIRELFGDRMPRSIDLEFNKSLLIHSSDKSMTFAQAVTPNIVHVGPLHLVKPKPLTAALEKWVSGAEDGLIYFSLGSNMQGTSLPAETRKAFLAAFSRFPTHRVIWKWESDSVLDRQSPNVQFRKWTPQQDLLAHPKVKLFISQCGLQSMQEAVHNAVPVICIPLYGDQESHAGKIDSARLGLVLDFNHLTTDIIYTAINNVLHDPIYKQNMQRMSDISRTRVMTPMEEAVWWIEYVLKFNGAPHLRPATLDLHWSQYLLLDVAAFVFFILSTALFIVYKVVKFIYYKYLTVFYGHKFKKP